MTRHPCVQAKARARTEQRISEKNYFFIKSLKIRLIESVRKLRSGLGQLFKVFLLIGLTKPGRKGLDPSVNFNYLYFIKWSFWKFMVQVMEQEK